MEGSLFISYSHVDVQWMHIFKKHLNGIFVDHCHIWTDEDIAAGSTWEDRLLGNLQQAAAGLILVSPDYLVSPWCRRELKSLFEANKSKRLAAVYWVLLKPCGWKWTELAELQAVQDPADQALLSFPEGQQRDTQLLRCCEIIADNLMPSLQKVDKILSVIRGILARSPRGARITPLQALKEGDFSIVARGLDANGNDIVIKVLTNTPLHRMRELFFQVSEACRKINEPSVVRTIDVFTDGDEYEQRIVIVSELARGVALSDVMNEDAALNPSKRHLTLDTIGLLLRRIAEALQALHELPPIAWKDGGDAPYRHFMGPLWPNNIFYNPATQRPQISLVGVTNFLWYFFEPSTFQRIVGPKNGTYLLPEKACGELVDHRADQYFLGMLALELLEGRSLFITAGDEQPADPLELLRNSRWAQRHEQLGGILSRMLAKEPNERFTDMAEVVANLLNLEDSGRALAKYSFRTYVAPEGEGDSAGTEFSKSFYERLFLRAPEIRRLFLDAHQQRMAARPQTEKTSTIPDETQHRKLTDGLKAVLNFRPGANPSSIDTVAARHVGFRLNAKQMEDFETCFIETLVQQFMQSKDEHADMTEITDAWKKLFAPVRAEMLDYPKRRTKFKTAAS